MVTVNEKSYTFSSQRKHNIKNSLQILLEQVEHLILALISNEDKLPKTGTNFPLSTLLDGPQIIHSFIHKNYYRDVYTYKATAK